MGTLHTTITISKTSLFVGVYLTLLTTAVLPIVLGSTVALLAISGVSFSDIRIRFALLPTCPPFASSCYAQSDSTPVPGTEDGAETDQTLPGGGRPPSEEDGNQKPGDLDKDTTNQGDQPSTSQTSSGNQDGTGGDEQDGSQGDSGGDNIAPATSLRSIIQEGITLGEKIDSRSPIVFSHQCEYIKSGKRILYDVDRDGLAQVPEENNLSSIMQEDFYKTDPKNPDTDYDSYFDGEEVCDTTDPLEVPNISPIDWKLVNRLKGKIVIQTERHGEAWYIYPNDGLRYYLRNGNVAYQVMRYLSLGITDLDLSKIPVGVDKRFQDIDTDNDGLADKLEESLKTFVQDPDTDDDGVLDGKEVLEDNTNPLGPGGIILDEKLTMRVRGRIVLQVQSRGEAWYVNPSDGKRYYMKDGEAAYQIMRFLSLGITNANINKMPIGTLKGKIK